MLAWIGVELLTLELKARVDALEWVQTNLSSYLSRRKTFLPSLSHYADIDPPFRVTTVVVNLPGFFPEYEYWDAGDDAAE